jgi:hypothetical protein
LILNVLKKASFTPQANSRSNSGELGLKQPLELLARRSSAFADRKPLNDMSPSFNASSLNKARLYPKGRLPDVITKTFESERTASPTDMVLIPIAW